MIHVRIYQINLSSFWNKSFATWSRMEYLRDNLSWWNKKTFVSLRTCRYFSTYVWIENKTATCGVKLTKTLCTNNLLYRNSSTTTFWHIGPECKTLFCNKQLLWNIIRPYELFALRSCNVVHVVQTQTFAVYIPQIIYFNLPCNSWVAMLNVNYKHSK